MNNYNIVDHNVPIMAQMQLLNLFYFYIYTILSCKLKWLTDKCTISNRYEKYSMYTAHPNIQIQNFVLKKCTCDILVKMTHKLYNVNLKTY